MEMLEIIERKYKCEYKKKKGTDSQIDSRWSMNIRMGSHL
jgi:hypothetical protein